VREYETTIIIQPEISEEGVAEFCTRIDGIVDESDGVRLMYDDQGRRRLAYEIENFQKGRYVMLHFLDSGQVIPKLERVLRLDDSVLRFLTVQVAEEVADIDARKAEAAEEVRIREERAAERAAREAEEAAARAVREAEAAAEAEKAAAEAEKVAAEAEKVAAAAAAAAEAAGDADDDDASDDTAGGEESGEAETAAPAAESDDSAEKES
jgi:small subunit ribosomal protein S6